MSGARSFVRILVAVLAVLAWATMTVVSAAPKAPVAGGAAKPAGSASPSASPSATSSQFVDGIAAIVNKQVITLGQVSQRMADVRQQMQLQRVPVPDEATLRQKVLQEMINDALQAQEAARVGIRVSDAQVNHAIQVIAQRNRLSVDQLKQEISAGGMNWEAYLAEIRTQVQDDMLRQRFVEDNIHITDSDVDAFLETHPDMPVAQPQAEPDAPPPAPPPPPKPTGPELVELAQILVEVPDYSSNEVVAEKRKQAEAILRKLKSGANFAGLAASSSDGPQALQGGDMGIRPLKDWPDLFIHAIKDTPPGHISGIIHSGRGFHILKVLRRGYAQPPQARRAPPPPPKPPEPKTQPASEMGPMMVTQTHVRHILIKTTKVVDDAKARSILEGLRTRIEHGESFAELAKRYSEDATAPQGGDLGWVNPGETVPAFEKAMDALKPGQVSEPVQTPFGWHLIQVEGRRTKNMKDEFLRIQARRELMNRRIGPAYEDWLDQLRSRAYIDNRLDKTKTPGR